jgi:16S rRNA (guanine527-N7)-methyltransferase
MHRSLDTVLSLGLEQMGLALPAEMQQKLLEFIALLEKWNRIYNLTAVRDPQQMLTHHILDSLAILPFVNGLRVLDIGSGAGLPGIPLALARPDLEFVLLDANAKKTRFMIQAIGTLDLNNIEVVHARVERYRPERKFDTLIARAFAGMAEILAATAHLVNPHSELLAMKGVYPQSELDLLPSNFTVTETHKLHVPGLDAERHLVRIACRSLAAMEP